MTPQTTILVWPPFVWFWFVLLQTNKQNNKAGRDLISNKNKKVFTWYIGNNNNNNNNNNNINQKTIINHFIYKNNLFYK